MHQNKVAIFIRGYKRTWDWVKVNNIQTYEQIYGNNIDWYVAVWKTNSVTYESILKDFEGKNLKSLRIVDEDDYPMSLEMRGHTQEDFYYTSTHRIDSYWRLAYLDLLLSHDKIKHELQSDSTYDTVLFTRFDLYCIFIGNAVKERCSKLKPFTISSEIDKEENYDFLIIDDYQYKTDSITADIIAFRFFDTHINDYVNQATPMMPETIFSNYLFRNNIIYDKSLSSFDLFLIRPDQVDLQKPITEYDIRLSASDNNWNFESFKYRSYHCNKLGIDTLEYIFDVNNINE